jgi:hypothetical protein
MVPETLAGSGKRSLVRYCRSWAKWGPLSTSSWSGREKTTGTVPKMGWLGTVASERDVGRGMDQEGVVQERLHELGSY